MLSSVGGIWRHAWRAPVPRNALKVALVVGLLLNLINQGSAFYGQDAISWPHVVLNFLVPYCVASYSAARVRFTEECILRRESYPTNNENTS
nr:nitrate/nitrite transporter NrtS [Marinimicrobium koreense]